MNFVPYSSSERTEDEYVRQDCNGPYASSQLADAAYSNVGLSNDEYAVGTKSDDAASSYTQQQTNGEYVVPQLCGKDFAVGTNTPPPYSTVALDDEGYTKQEANGPYTVSTSTPPDYAKATFKKGEGYALETRGAEYVVATKDDREYIEVTRNGEYVHSE